MERFNDLYCCGPALKARYVITFLDSVEGFREVGSTTVDLKSITKSTINIGYTEGRSSDFMES